MGDNGANNGCRIPPDNRFYKAAFSYASENREYVTKVYECLVSLVEDSNLCKKEKIFFDIPDFQQGKVNGAKPLKTIYSKQTEFIVPFHCEKYKCKPWTRIEHKEIIYLIDNDEDKCIIPVRFDATEISGFEKFTDVYIDAEYYTSDTTPPKESIPPEDVAQKIFDRLSTSTPRGAQLLRREKWEAKRVDYLALQKIFQAVDQFLIKDEEKLKRKERKMIRDLLPQVIDQSHLDHFPKINDISYLTTIDWLAEKKSYNYLPKFIDLFIRKRRQDLDENLIKEIEDWLNDCCTLRLKINRDDLNPHANTEGSKGSGVNDGNNNIFPFTNRKKELELVLNSKIKDQLITAPVSYGKATFLEKLEEKFEERNYVTCLHTIDEQNQVADTDQLCKYLGYADTKDFIHTILTSENIDKIKNKGLVFLFVTKKMLAQNLKLLKVSIDQIRLQIKGKLEADNCDYTLPDIKIRLVVSSHQLYGDPRNEINWPYGFEALRLSEFTNQVIQDSLYENNFFNGKNYKEYGAIVAKLTLLTAGHPLLVKNVALHYKENKKFNLQTIKNDIIILTQGFSASIKNRTIKALFNKKELTLYRYLNDLVLANLASKNPIKRKELTDSLLAHGIYEKATINGDETDIIRDSLLRRTCLLDYCYREPEEFLTKLKMAQSFYKGQFINPQFRVEYTVLWLAEWLFSQLQEKLLSFVWDRSTYLKKIPEKTFSNNYFDDNEVSESITYFVNQFNDKKRLKETKDCLLNRLKADWEFQLLLNYQPFQSDTQCYSTDAYNNLVSRIETIFAPQQGAEDE